MVYDLRAINAILRTDTVPVPNPYTALTAITTDQKWFTCIELANVFFCLALHESLRDIFSFTYKASNSGTRAYRKALLCLLAFLTKW